MKVVEFSIGRKNIGRNGKHDIRKKHLKVPTKVEILI
jgi:hypothetical protein